MANQPPRGEPKKCKRFWAEIILIVVYSLLDCWCFWCGYLVLKWKHIGGVLD